MSPQGKRRKPPPPARNVRAERGSHKLAALAVFAIFVVGSLIVVAAAQGLGGPSVPEGDIAVIEDAPDGTITSEDFDSSLEQTAARQGLREVPPPDDPQYELLVDAAVSDLILSRWVLGEAEERGIEVTDREIDEELETVIEPAVRLPERVRGVPRPIRLHAGGGATSASRCSWSPTGSSRRSCRRSRRSPRTSSARTTTRTSPSSSSPRRATSA